MVGRSGHNVTFFTSLGASTTRSGGSQSHYVHDASLRQPMELCSPRRVLENTTHRGGSTTRKKCHVMSRRPTISNHINFLLFCWLVNK
jgi:hypothetical protein